MAWEDLLAAFGLVLVFEGLLPFLSPRATRDTLARLAQADDRVLRGVGLASMAGGVLTLYLVR